MFPENSAIVSPSCVGESVQLCVPTIKEKTLKKKKSVVEGNIVLIFRVVCCNLIRCDHFFLAEERKKKINFFTINEIMIFYLRSGTAISLLCKIEIHEVQNRFEEAPI